MSVQAIVCAMALQDINPAEKLVILAIANYADEHMQCWPSQSRLAADTCMSDRNVRRIMCALEERGMLSRKPRRRQDGYRAADLITLHFAGAVEPISPDILSEDNISPDNFSEDNSAILTGQIRPISPDNMSAPTTFEPVIEPSEEPRGRATRLPHDWRPPPQLFGWAMEQGFSVEQVEQELEGFRDHWTAAAGANARKLDWTAAFRSWLRRSRNQFRGRGSSPAGASRSGVGHGGATTFADVFVRRYGNGRT